MLKKSKLLAFLLSTVILGTASWASVSIAQESTPMAVSIPTLQQDDCDSDHQVESAASETPVLLDRSGMDKASVHLQILQQSSTHFSDITQAKKPAAEDKKSPPKALSNS